MHKSSRSIHVSISNLGKLIKATCDIIVSRLSSKKLHLSVPSAENTLQITIGESGVSWRMGFVGTLRFSLSANYEFTKGIPSVQRY